ncbi:hypothetical protein Q1695_001072 [Nippostrongylus brasiliensis]|nr:hypothetical protein Q1695_001072 [Nippostrongylus brasiliensis]
MSTSAAGEKLPPAITQKVLKPMERAQAWAGRQLNKAQQMIRELSVSHPDPRDIALQDEVGPIAIGDDAKPERTVVLATKFFSALTCIMVLAADTFIML